MALPIEALRQTLSRQPVSRRNFGIAVGTGLAGLAGAAMIGCEPKSPQRLFAALASAPIDLPPDITFTGKDSTGFTNDSEHKPKINRVSITIADRTYKTAPDRELGNISYSVYQNRKDAFLAFADYIDSVSDRPSKSIEIPSIKTLGALIRFSDYYVGVTNVDNVLVSVKLDAPSDYPADTRIAALLDSAVKHLQKIK